MSKNINNKSFPRRKSGGKGRRKALSQEAMQSRAKEKILYEAFSTGATRPRPKPGPKGARNGAMYSHRSLLETFTDSTGLSLGNNIEAIPTSPLFGSIAFEVGDLDDFSSLSAAFDQYRIDYVDVYIRPRSNLAVSPIATSPNQSNPSLYAVVDRDDTNTPTSIAQLRQYNECTECADYEGIHFGFIPSVTPAYYQSGSFVGYGVEEGKWIDVASSAVPHYGIKFAVSPLQAASTAEIFWAVEAYVHTSWKSAR